MEEEKKTKKGYLRLIIIAAAVLLVLGVTYLILRLSGLGLGSVLDAVRGGTAQRYPFDRSEAGYYAAVGDGFATLSGSALRVRDRSGEEKLGLLLSFREPVLSTAEDFGAAWDMAGTDFIVFSDGGLRYRSNADGRLISVTVNSRGYAAVCSEETGYGGSVTVYNPNGRALYKMSSGSDYVLSGYVRDGSELLVLTLGAQGSRLSLYRLGREGAVAQFSTQDVIIDAGFTDNGVAAISSSEVYFLSRNLEETGNLLLEGKKLVDYRLFSKGAAVLLGDYAQSGSTLKLIGQDGTAEAVLDLPGEARSIDYRDGTVSVLTSGVIYLYSDKLELKGDSPAPSGCDRVLLRDKDTVIAVETYSASVFDIRETSEEREEKQ
ncbi:MAG: hypothetical protein II794_01580 [Oscillospiraceae bacterium]|nr:hypothetical protein [Oscillospiraceae bacterium]